MEFMPDPVRVKVPFLKSGVSLGDLVAKATKAVGIQPCGGCKGRQAALNRAVRLVPYRLPLPQGHILKQQGQRDQDTQILLTKSGNSWFTMEYAAGAISQETPFADETLAKADFSKRMIRA
jgi:hypothetical protein